MDAAMHGHAEVVKLLLEAGATVIKTKDVSGFIVSPLWDNTISGTQMFTHTHTMIILLWLLVLKAGHLSGSASFAWFIYRHT